MWLLEVVSWPGLAWVSSTGAGSDHLILLLWLAGLWLTSRCHWLTGSKGGQTEPYAGPCEWTVPPGRPACGRTGREQGLGWFPASCSRGGTFCRPSAACGQASVRWCPRSRCSGWGSLFPASQTATPRRSHTIWVWWRSCQLWSLGTGCLGRGRSWQRIGCWSSSSQLL